MDAIDTIFFAMLFGTILVFCIRYSHLDAIVRRLIYYLVIIAVSNSTSLYIGLILHRHNLFVDHFSTPLEYAALAIVFYHSLDHPFIKKAVAVSVPVFILLSVYLSLYVDTMPDNNNSVAKVIRALLSTTWILIFFRQLLTSDKVLNASREPLFWIYASFLFLFLGTMFLQGFFTDLNKLHKELAERIYTSIEYSCNYVLFIGINVGFFISRSTRIVQSTG